MASKFNTGFNFINDALIWATLSAARREALDYYLNESMSDGAYGAAFEILSAAANSRKKGVAKQGRVDVWGKALDAAANKYKRCGLEIKTNGGRVTNILEAVKRGSNGVVIYTLSLGVTNKKSTTERYFPPCAFRYETFISILNECGAIKPMYHGGELDGYGIQVTSKKLYLRLWEAYNNGECELFNPNEPINI